MNQPIQISQNPDIRYLGRILGEVIRAQGGETLFRRTEYIRSASVDRHRGIAGAEAIDPGLDALSLDDTIAFVRGFMLFSMLANLAEDRQGVAAEPGATVAAALDRLAAEGIDGDAVAALLERALVAPVLTAHPTEVRRKSVLDHKNRIAELMRLRDAGRDETPEGDSVEAATPPPDRAACGRRGRCAPNACSSPTRSTMRSPICATSFCPSCRGSMRAGKRSWGGAPRASCASEAGSAATATAIPSSPPKRWRRRPDATRRRCSAIIATRCTALGTELSVSQTLAPVPETVTALADASGDEAPSRSDEPYRRALSGIYARLCATHVAIVGHPPPRPSMLAGEPYAAPADFRRDLVTLADGLSAGGEGQLGGLGALGRLIRAVEVFGFHLATLDMRQNSAVHERVLAELLRVSGVEGDYLALDEEARVALLRRELAVDRPLAAPWHRWSEETAGELAIVHAAAAIRARLGREAICQWIISKAESLSDLLEVHVLAREAGLWSGDADDALMVVPLFETIADLDQAPAIMAAYFALPEIAQRVGARGSQEVMIGYSDSNKDGGLSDLDLGAASGIGGADPGVRGGGHRDAAVPRPRRRGRARRWQRLCGDPRTARGHGAGPHPHHRAGRGDRGQIWHRR